jgi:hypothetical protein
MVNEIDLHKANKRKVLDEQTTRANMLSAAREIGCEGELKQIFAMTDAKLRGVSNEVERKEIVVEAISLIERLLTSTPEDVVLDGKRIKL